MAAAVAAAIVCTALTCVAAAAEPAKAAAARQPDRVVAWARQHAVPLRTLEQSSQDSDLRAIGALVGPETRIIGFGEPVHGAREPLLMRNRLFAYLVEHCGVTAYAAETSFTSATKIDDYVTRGGELTEEIWRSVYIAGPAVANVPTTGKARDAAQDEDRQLLQWMRAYNLRSTTKRPIRFYGIDICSKSGDGTGACMRAAVRAALDYLLTVDSAAAKAFEQRLVPYLPFYDAHDASSAGETPSKVFTSVERDAFAAAIADMVSLFAEKHVFWVRRTSSLAYHRAYRNAVVAQRMDGWVRMNLVDPAPGDIWVNDMGKRDVRDSSMEENVLWALEREGAQGRLFLFAHDAHLDKSIPVMLGAHLHEALGRQYVVIGSTGLLAKGRAAAGLNMGSFQVTWLPSLAALFASAGSPLLFLDVRAMPPIETTASERAHTRFRSHITPQWRVGDSYDAMIFFDSLSTMWRYQE